MVICDSNRKRIAVDVDITRQELSFCLVYRQHFLQDCLFVFC